MSGAFNYCTSLPAELVLQATLTSLGSSTFQESSVRSFDLSQCTLGSTSEQLDLSYNLFGECTSLLLPEKGYYSLGWEAFDDSKLKELRIPSAVSYIYGNEVLPSTLERLYVGTATPIQVDNSAFNSLDFDICMLYIPMGAADAYSEADGWSNFTKIQEQGFKVVITGYGTVQIGSQTYSDGDVFFAVIDGEGVFDEDSFYIAMMEFGFFLDVDESFLDLYDSF